MRIGRSLAIAMVAATVLPCWGCGLAPHDFRKIQPPEPLVRARPVGQGGARVRRAGRAGPRRLPRRRGSRSSTWPPTRSYASGRAATSAMWPGPATRRGPARSLMGAPARRTLHARLRSPADGAAGPTPAEGRSAQPEPAGAAPTRPDSADETARTHTRTRDRTHSTAYGERPLMIATPGDRPRRRFSPDPAGRLDRRTVRPGGDRLPRRGELLSAGAAIGWMLRRRDALELRAGRLRLRTMVRQLSWMLAFGFPLVGLVHVAMGSFLSMQAYYGSTFHRRHRRGRGRGVVALWAGS